MPWIPGRSNLYEPPTKHYAIYHIKKNGDQKWTASRKYPDGRTKNGTFFSRDDAQTFLDNLPPEHPGANEGCEFWYQNKHTKCP
jgi:hypothetical protein